MPQNGRSRLNSDGCKGISTLRLEANSNCNSAAQVHPDKQTATIQTAPESVFVALKIAQDTLTNPVKRFAYDRFGPQMLSWENCATIKEYLYTGFQATSPSYMATAIMMLALGGMGYLDWGKFVCFPYAMIA